MKEVVNKIKCFFKGHELSKDIYTAKMDTQTYFLTDIGDYVYYKFCKSCKRYVRVSR